MKTLFEDMTGLMRCVRRQFEKSDYHHEGRRIASLDYDAGFVGIRTTDGEYFAVTFKHDTADSMEFEPIDKKDWLLRSRPESR